MPDRTTTSGPTPASTFVLGIVVEPGLEVVLHSIDAQRYAGPVRTFLMDPGHDAGASAVAKRWVESHPATAVLLPEHADGLQARNALLAAALADITASAWISFPGAPDQLSPGYLADIAGAIEKHEKRRAVSAVVGRRYRWDPDTGQTTVPPILDQPFTDGRTAVVDLVVQPEDAPNDLRTTFVRLAALAGPAGQFDQRLEAGFADQDLLLRVLAAESRPVCLYVDTAYLFRMRGDDPAGGRALFTRREKFTDVLRKGHLALLRSFGPRGAAPAFVQHAVLLDLAWYFQADEALTGQMNAEMHQVEDEFHGLVAAILDQVDPHVLESVEPARLPADRHVALMHGYARERWHEEWVVLDARDTAQGLNRLTYRFTGDVPAETIRLDGQPIAPRIAKTRDIVYAGRALVRERILWVSAAGSVSVELDGAVVPISRAPRPRSRYTWSPRAVADAFAGRRAPAQVRSLPARILDPQFWLGFAVRRIARSGPVARRYGGSWVLMDRVESAHDNAEHLFVHLQNEEPDIRSWFAVEKNSKDWKRLRSQGFRNLLAYGSIRWMLVCLNATHVLSSQAGPYVYDPAALRPIQRPSWRFIFLQHGVIATDLHRWLNRRKFDLFLTTTEDEYAAIAGDGSEYRFTPHEVALTGLPRHDRLKRLDARLPRAERSRILVLPTWREYLLGASIDAKGLRPLREDFAETLYARSWFGLLRSDRLRDLAKAHGATIAFMPHPNVQPYLDQFGLPDHVETLTYADNDIQAVLTSAKVVVTDFSSIVFDTAFIGRPVVYYQFDQAEAFGGTHTVRQGYFSYEEDGFGPVAYDEDGTLDALEEIAAAGFEPSPEHADRMERAFPNRDDRSSARVVTAVRNLQRRPSPDEATTPVAVPVAPRNRPTPRSHVDEPPEGISSVA